MATSTRTQPVVQGGLFSTPKASFSKETQVLLKGIAVHMLLEGSARYHYANGVVIHYYTTVVYSCFMPLALLLPSMRTVMMQESKLTNFQQRRLSEKMTS